VQTLLANCAVRKPLNHGYATDSHTVMIDPPINGPQASHLLNPGLVHALCRSRPYVDDDALTGSDHLRRDGRDVEVPCFKERQRSRRRRQDECSSCCLLQS